MFALSPVPMTNRRQSCFVLIGNSSVRYRSSHRDTINLFLNHCFYVPAMYLEKIIRKNIVTINLLFV
ncbi:unnamed protein product [Acanthoscelides obtectus]|uniref:Uncharacterized protein n=1 Tax=Acanthoscelides obtectus TaxID=200917 RepID=A0A9P0PFQ5_ACAOB|nr:unnamed protein product [Acanthoscelides obtectus]CAK1674951.1 hypothetical protein AOBTE_LOCUS29829 [Acanthoscelides obtectus]